MKRDRVGGKAPPPGTGRPTRSSLDAVGKRTLVDALSSQQAAAPSPQDRSPNPQSHAPKIHVLPLERGVTYGDISLFAGLTARTTGRDEIRGSPGAAVGAPDRTPADAHRPPGEHLATGDAGVADPEHRAPADASSPRRASRVQLSDMPWVASRPPRDQLPGGGPHGAAVQRTPAGPSTGASATRAPEVTPPSPGIDKPGFIDHSDGSYLRTGPRESGGQTVRDQPLPPATRVFVSGTHPSAPAWWYVTAYLPDAMVRGYVQGDRVTTDLPEPLAELRQLVGGETAEGLAREKFGGAVTDGHDLRYYENVLLYVNRGRAGIRGTYQDPGLLGGGSNHIQLVAGHRIWLVSAEYAKTLQRIVPSGSLTGGAVAKVKRFAGHLQDILASVTESRDHLGEVAGELAQAIRDHLPEIVGITAGFVMAEATSLFLAAVPTGVSQAAAVVIQLALSAFGAAGMVQAGAQALQHGSAWLVAAWTAHGRPEAITAASKEFLQMLVAIAMAALSYVGARGNYGRALQIARSMPTGGLPALATAGSRANRGAHAGARVSIGPGIGPLGAAGNAMPRVDDEDPIDVVDYVGEKATTRRPKFDEGESQAGHGHRDDVCFPEEYEDIVEQGGYQITGARDVETTRAARAANRPTWQESEQRVSRDLDWADFSDQRSFLDKKDVTRGIPGSTRPDNFSEKFRLSVDVKNYDISTSRGRSSFVEKVVQQMTKRAPHLPDGIRQGVVIDARGQAVSEETLTKLRTQIIRKADGLADPDNIVFLME